MHRSPKLLLTLLATVACTGAVASPASAIVGGHDTSDAAYKGVAEIVLGGAFGCTGTLIAPQWVLTAGHCGSITGGTGVGTPAAFPAATITVRMGSDKAGQGTKHPVSQVVIPPSYLATQGWDISLLKLTTATTAVPATKIAGPSGRALWNPDVVESIVGWGVTSEGGSAPSTLQEASVPIVADATCASAYDSFEAQTQVCAGYPQGGTDTCQGDSGGPMFGHDAAGALKVVGSTSYGEGCARPNRPGVYARVADTTLRSWIASQAPGSTDS
jgi:secreted trypsin-like serine protease